MTVGATTGVGNPAGAGATLGSDGWLANDTAMTIAPEISFSVDAKYRASARGSQAGLAFGWAQGGTSVYNATTAQTITVGVTNVTQGNYRLSVAGGISSHGTSGFGTATPVALTVDNWYRLSGTILFDGGTNTFTFNDVGFYDLGEFGTDAPIQLLSGTGETLTNAAWTGATQGQVSVLTNRDRGFQVLDNVYAAAIPEPSAALLGGLGMLALLRRRR